jgi:hypothetical protein
VRIGEKLEAQYHLPAPNGGKAWVGLIPEAVTETGEADNDAADVSYSYTVDAAEAALNLDLPQAGRYRLRLFSGAGGAEPLLAESPVITVEQWPLGDRAAKTAPYLTINPVGTDKAEVQEGFPVPVYFEVPADYPDTAWIGVVPTSVKSPLEGDNDAADVQYWYLKDAEQGPAKGSFTWTAEKPGEYVFRLFPNTTGLADYTAQSETFTVIPKK